MSSNSTIPPSYVLIATLDDYSEASTILPTLSTPVSTMAAFPSLASSSSLLSSQEDPFLVLRLTRHYTRRLGLLRAFGKLRALDHHRRRLESPSSFHRDRVRLPFDWFLATKSLRFLASTPGLDVSSLRRTLRRVNRFLSKGNSRMATKWTRVAEIMRRRAKRKLSRDRWSCRVNRENVCVADEFSASSEAADGSSLYINGSSVTTIRIATSLHKLLRRNWRGYLFFHYKFVEDDSLVFFSSTGSASPLASSLRKLIVSLGKRGVTMVEEPVVTGSKFFVQAVGDFRVIGDIFENDNGVDSTHSEDWREARVELERSNFIRYKTLYLTFQSKSIVIVKNVVIQFDFWYLM